LRQLLPMALARQEAEWERTSWIIATLININATKGQRVTPDDVNPMKRRKRSTKKQKWDLLSGPMKVSEVKASDVCLSQE
jgi:hypothetical protein